MTCIVFPSIYPQDPHKDPYTPRNDDDTKPTYCLETDFPRLVYHSNVRAINERSMHCRFFGLKVFFKNSPQPALYFLTF